MEEKKKKGEFPNRATQFKKGQSGNPKGRPPKAIRAIVKEHLAKDYQIPSNDDILDALALLLNLSEGALKEISEDANMPFLFRTIAQTALGRGKMKLVNAVLDRVIGKPRPQSVEASETEFQIKVIETPTDNE